MYITILCIIVGAVSIASIILARIYLWGAFWGYVAWVVFIDLLFAAFIYTKVFL